MSSDVHYTGTRYEATVPDTLDLTQRAELALNGLAGTIDPQLDYQMHFWVYYAHRTPYMSHWGCDVTCDTKLGESFPMLRLMCGSDRYAEVEVAQRAALLTRLEDGLYWNRVDPRRPWGNSYKPDFDGQLKDEDLCNMAGTARMLRTLVTWREISGDSAWDRPIREMVAGLSRLVVQRGDYAYYPDGGFGEPFNYPRSGWLRTDEPQSDTEGGEGSVTSYQAHQIQGLSRWYALSGDAQALELAGRLTRFCMLAKFWGGVPDPAGTRPGLVGHVAGALPDPAYIAGNEQGHWYSHFHSRAVALRGMLAYAVLVGDLRVIEFVRRAYEYTWTLGIPRTGWINCYPASECNGMAESCALGDLVALGVRLSDAGAGDYWDDVDAVVRNQLIEQQVVRADLLQRVAEASPARAASERSRDPGKETEDRVIERTLGNFFGQGGPTSIPKPWVMQCCTGNATQGLYYAWEGSVREDGDRAQVNLLLNRAAPGLDVDSYLPYEGKVVVHNKNRRLISIRIPWWAPRRELRAWVNDSPRDLEWTGNYLLFGGLGPGDTIKLEFPVTESSGSYTVNARTKDEQTYSCHFRGSTLVDISPRDEAPTSYPLYLRDHLKSAGVAPLIKVSRFVADGRIANW